MRILAEAELEETEWAKQRYEQLNLIDERKLKVLYHGQCYQQMMARAFNARVRHREFKPGDLVLRKVLHVVSDSRGKFLYKYDGPFVVRETFSGRAIILSDMDGTKNTLPVNFGIVPDHSSVPHGSFLLLATASQTKYSSFSLWASNLPDYNVPNAHHTCVYSRHSSSLRNIFERKKRNKFPLGRKPLRGGLGKS
ncbi:hypothetical protein CRG98_039460 [Punica granatum]|uniref:Uncharacterized protein n=1 Tax=Punica granatum TaxID=22663 RepID=A0A2I0I830_PUNGR|nr:hypothetical protein CRG98_039460 [Punica granatum]